MDVRSQNKEKRRQRILFEARRIITCDGFDALTTRGLADAAGVTQPTLYNLIGTKDDIFRVLMVESMTRIWERLQSFEGANPLDTIEAVIMEPIELFAADEGYYRAAVIAGDRVHASNEAGSDLTDAKFFIDRESVRMATEATQNGIDAGLLKGRVPAEILGEQIYICCRTPMRDWAYGFISLEQFRTQALRGIYMTLAIDAAPEFHSLLEQKTFEQIVKATAKSVLPAKTVQRRLK